MPPIRAAGEGIDVQESVGQGNETAIPGPDVPENKVFLCVPAAFLYALCG